MNRLILDFDRVVQALSTFAIVLPSIFAIAFDANKSSQTVDDTPVFMRAKLASSQRVMEGLVTEDFAMIKKGAQEMQRISEANHWPKSPDRVYDHYTQAFQNQCRKLASQADANNLEAAHYTYLHMATSCIDCHDYVRGNFRIKRAKDNQGPIQLIPTEWDTPTSRKNGRIPTRPSKYLRDQDK